jgi:hypothetical protein
VTVFFFFFLFPFGVDATQKTAMIHRSPTHPLYKTQQGEKREESFDPAET